MNTAPEMREWAEHTSTRLCGLSASRLSRQRLPLSCSGRFRRAIRLSFGIGPQDKNGASQLTEWTYTRSGHCILTSVLRIYWIIVHGPDSRPPEPCDENANSSIYLEAYRLETALRRAPKMLFLRYLLCCIECGTGTPSGIGLPMGIELLELFTREIASLLVPGISPASGLPSPLHFGLATDRVSRKCDSRGATIFKQF
jgi:hypothetical protein